jgi:DtxR family transcriptional regulator, Mn-dependent transcriptional regulator
MNNQSTEDYLRGIYKLSEAGGDVTTSALARHLGIGDGSVTGMVKKLAAKKLIRHVPYRGVSLTEAGRRTAVTMMRRHRLWEIFLVRHLGYGWDEVHDEAERLEHATSDEMERRLDEMLGRPDTDPHGEPVPTADGRLAPLKGKPLRDFSPGARLSVIRVRDDSSAILQHAAKLGVSLGTRLTVREKRGFDGSMVVAVGRHERFLSREVAAAIFAEKS